MDKLEHVLLSFATMLSIASFVLIAQRFVTRNIIGFDKYNSVAWNMEHRWVRSAIGLIGALIWAPLAEEFIFRMPLLLAFDSLTTTAWIFIVILGCVFGFGHWSRTSSSMGPVYKARKNGEHESDNVKSEKKRIYDQTPSKNLKWNIAKASQSCCTGALYGYLVVHFQNIWYSVALHFAWNLLMPLVLVPTVVIVLLVKHVFFSKKPEELDESQADNYAAA